ncbi:MAG: Fic family protein [Acidimicrobiales bacterium]
MDPTKFGRTEYGQVVRTEGDHGFFAFLPSAIPREIKLDSRTVLLLSEADDALGRLAGVGRLLPNPHLLASAYLTQEAVASSRIEGTQASLSEVFRAVAGGGSPPSSDVQEVRNYIAALEHGLARLQELPVCLRLTREIHRTLMTNVRGREQHPGEFRTTQNWIGSSGDRPDTAAFVPPPVDHLADCLADWERYANETPPVPLLVQCGLLHYQFETIHPFLDGNGRLGRLLIVLFLVSRARLPQPLLYISRFFEDNRAEYYDRLQGVRERGEIQEWLQLFLSAVAVQARDAVDRAEALVDIRERYRQALRGSRSRAPEVVDLLLGNPVLTTGRVERELAVTNAGALNLIRQLESLEVVQDAGRAGRGGRRVWVAHDVLTVLEGRSGDDQTAPGDHDGMMREDGQ